MCQPELGMVRACLHSLGFPCYDGHEALCQDGAPTAWVS